MTADDQQPFEEAQNDPDPSTPNVPPTGQDQPSPVDPTVPPVKPEGFGPPPPSFQLGQDAPTQQAVPQGQNWSVPPQPTSYYGPQSQQSSTLSALVPAKNKPALIGYYLGVFGLIPCCMPVLGMAAIPCGILGLGKIKADPTLPGKTHSIVAIVLGGLEVAFFLAALVFWARFRALQDFQGR